MPYLGKQPASVPVTADDIPNDSITTAKIVDAAITIADIGPNAVGSSEMADDAVGLNELSATGTTNTSTFLRGDNSWAVPPTTDISGKLSLSGGAMTGAITTNSTFDGVDIATRDAVLTSTTTTANAALPKAGGTMTGGLSGTTAAFSSTITANGQAQLNNNNLIALNTGATSEWIAKRTSSGEGIHITTTNASGADTQRLAITSNADTANFLIKASNVGIGTTTIASPEGNSGPILQIGDGSNAMSSIVLHEDGNKWEVVSNNDLIIQDESVVRLRIAQAGDITFSDTSQAAKVTIKNDGKVGIGTTSPSGPFHINSTGNTNATTTYITRGDGTNSLPASIDTQTSLLLMNSSDTYSNYLSIISAPTGTSGINLGDSADENIGQIGYFNNGNTMRFKVGAAEKIRLTSDGLTFNGDTAAANALDDYEEGTHTMSWTTGNSGSITMNRAAVSYTKIGRVVTIVGEVDVDTVSSPVGGCRVTLPFVIADSTVARNNSFTTRPGMYHVPHHEDNPPYFIGHANTSHIEGIYERDNASFVDWNPQAGEACWFSFSYMTT